MPVLKYEYVIESYVTLLGIAILILVIIIFLAIALFVIRNITHLVINAIVGLITLFVVNFFHLMQYVNRPDIGYDWITIIICALAGFPGAILLVILSVLGITL